MLVTIVGILWSVVFKIPLVIGFLPGYGILVYLAIKRGLKWHQILHISLQGVFTTRIVIIILLLVSLLMPSWYLSGTIDQMVKAALSIINPQHFFVLSFIIAMIFSMILGTTVGTLSAVGVPILGTAMFLNLPLEIVAGALVSGAFVGDRTSPFSSAHQLLAHTLEVPVKRQGKAMLLTTILAVSLSILIYGSFDFFSGAQEQVRDHQSFLMDANSLIKVVPPLVLILMVILKIRITYVFISSILAASFISLISGLAVQSLAAAFWRGIDGIGGGLENMYELLLFLALAGAYNGLVERLNVIQPYLDKWLVTSRSLVGDTGKTLVATLLISMISANQTLPIILTGRSFLPHWSSRYSKEELARVMGDTTMLFPGMVPWSVLAIMCSTILGLPILDYLPYAIFLWILPLLTLTISFVKAIGISKRTLSVLSRVK
ncbi:sodium:proton antiporter [Bacillus sp. MRMR6]|nr:sodium:proton antiporter [Bacillus sp. MRMR6]